MELNKKGMPAVQGGYNINVSLVIWYNTLTICKTIAPASQGPYFVEFSTVSRQLGKFR